MRLGERVAAVRRTQPGRGIEAGQFCGELAVMARDAAEQHLIARLRQADADAWQECIARYEGRLMAFVDSRMGDRTASEDIVQEVFVGFLTSLPNYDEQTPLESFLFAIAAHKLIDRLRQRGRRPVLRLEGNRSGSSSENAGGLTLSTGGRRVSSLAASREQRNRDELLLQGILAELIATWRSRGEIERLQCIELLFVAGWPNRRVALELGISEQGVANHKSYVVSQIRKKLEKFGCVDGLPADLQAP